MVGCMSWQIAEFRLCRATAFGPGWYCNGDCNMYEYLSTGEKLMILTVFTNKSLPDCFNTFDTDFQPCGWSVHAVND